MGGCPNQNRRKQYDLIIHALLVETLTCYLTERDCYDVIVMT